MFAILLSNDLLISSQVKAAATGRGWQVSTVGTVDDLPEQIRDGMPRLVLVDLSLPGLDVARVVGLVQEAEGRSGPVVAFGPHVQTARLTAAADAGCDRVLTRGQLIGRLGEILGDYLASEPPSCGEHPPPPDNDPG